MYIPSEILRMGTGLVTANGGSGLLFEHAKTVLTIPWAPHIPLLPPSGNVQHFYPTDLGAEGKPLRENK